jgi:hypothetical protein
MVFLFPLDQPCPLFSLRRDRDVDRDDDRGGSSSRRSYYEPRSRKHDDGSFQGGPTGSNYAGLGSHSQSENVDSYSAYRKVRSGAYHEMIAQGSGFSNVSRGR